MKTTARFLRKRKYYIAFVVLILYLFYSISGSKSVAKDSPVVSALDGTDLSLEDKCNVFFESLVDQNDDWATQFHTKDITKIQTYVQRMRIYGQCYLRNKFVPKNFRIADVETKLFTIFNRVQLAGENYEGLGVSMFSDYGSGRGIAISIGQLQVNDFKRLLTVLAEVENALPIEVVYKGDLRSDDIQSILVLAKTLMPPQQVHFVDVENRIIAEHFSKFSRFANKWLPAIFTSFEEVIIVDADVVPFVNPVKFFELDGYAKTGSYFFRDRAISDELLKSRDIQLYQSLLPTTKEETVFELPNNGMKRLGLLGKYVHIMESGVVVINRRKFMPGLLIGFALQLWMPTSTPVWGDKELFWIGQSLAGEEDYFLTPKNAGTIGMLKSLNGHKLETAKQRIEEESAVICSTHPAHFDVNNKLLWVNSGLSNCKLNTWSNDFSKYKSISEQFDSEKDAQQYYQDVISVNGAIIPERWDFGKLRKQTQAGFLKDELLGCSGYYWCAYDTPKYPGTRILFNKKELELIDRVKLAWYLAV